MKSAKNMDNRFLTTNNKISVTEETVNQCVIIINGECIIRLTSKPSHRN